jgi:uncharacterized protein YndB with AHSA1/START domain
VKYVDGPTVEVSVLVNAPIETVWALITDLDVPARFSTEFLGATWLDEPPGVGARFVGRSQHPALGEWETTSHVSRYDPPHSFGWDVTDRAHPSASWWFDLSEASDGISLRYGSRIGPAPSGLTIAITRRPDKEELIIARRLEEFERNMTATVAGIKALAEATA